MKTFIIKERAKKNFNVCTCNDTHGYTSIRVLLLYLHLLYNNGALIPCNMAVTCYYTQTDTIIMHSFSL